MSVEVPTHYVKQPGFQKEARAALLCESTASRAPNGKGVSKPVVTTHFAHSAQAQNSVAPSLVTTVQML